MKNKIHQPRQEGPPDSSGRRHGSKGNPTCTAASTPDDVLAHLFTDVVKRTLYKDAWGKICRIRKASEMEDWQERDIVEFGDAIVTATVRRLQSALGAV